MESRIVMFRRNSWIVLLLLSGCVMSPPDDNSYFTEQKKNTKSLSTAAASSAPVPPSGAPLPSPAPAVVEEDPIRPFDKWLPPSVETSTTSSRQIALLIGIGNYEGRFPTLDTPTKDVERLAGVLESRYGFEIIKLLDQQATEDALISTMVHLAGTMTDQDSLLIYFAGHGEIDPTGVGTWILYDTKSALSGFTVAQVRERVGVMPAKRILIVADSCFAGALTQVRSSRTLGAYGHEKPIQESDAREVANRLVSNQRRSRQVITSGNLHPVADSGTCPGHSPFACSLISTLESVPPGAVVGAREVWMELMMQYRSNPTNWTTSESTSVDEGPQYSPFQNHMGGEFVFSPKS